MKSLKQNYDRHLVVTIIVLVALPILLGSSTFIIIDSFYRDQTILFFYQKFNNINAGEQFLNYLSLMQYLIFIVMLIFYPVYAYIFSIENHLCKRNPKSVISEYQALKKIVYVLLPLFIFTIALTISRDITPHNPLNQLILSSDQVLQSLLISILSTTLFVFASALLRLILLNASKQFKYFFARLSFKVISIADSDDERIKYLIEGLNSYNSYIRRTLGLQIDDLKRIYSTFIVDENIAKNRSMEELIQAFNDDDKLKPIRCLTGLFHVTKPEDFFIKESIGKKLQGWISILGAIISSITAIIGAMATLFTSMPSPH